MRFPKRVLVLALVLCSFSLVTSGQQHAMPVPRIIPTPQHFIRKNLQFALTKGTAIVLESNSRQDRFAALQINEELARWKSRALPVTDAKELRQLPAKFIFVGNAVSQTGRRLLSERKGTLPPEMAEEGYFLDVDAKGVVILAASDRGRFYGVMTLLQLMRREKNSVVIDGATVTDFPLYKQRGISDDISRGQVSTLANFKKIIRFLARYKMNTFSPYIEDMFTFKNHPLIGRGRGALTAAELRELDAYAGQYHVTTAPIFQTLGHAENLLAIPEYLGYAEYPGGRTLNVSDEKTYTLLDEMIGEIAGSYSGPYFNMAADETRDVGLGASKERVAKLGLPKVLADHYTRVAAIIRKYGKTPMIYGDIILKNPEILQMIPKDIVIVDWNYDPQYQYDTPGLLKRAGFPVVVSPAVRNYRGPFLDFLNSFENIQRFSRAGYDEKTEGLLISSWNDYGGEELRELNYYGYAWGAECAWQPLKPDVASFSEAFFRYFFGTHETESVRAAYAILSSPSNNYTWYELWRNPMLPFMPPAPLKGHSAVIMERLQSIESTMPLVISLLKKAETVVHDNNDHLRYLDFVARLNLWFSKKVQVGEKVRELSRWASSSPRKDSVAAAIVSLCESVIGDLKPLSLEFDRLWKISNRPEGLEYLLMRHDRQKAFWQEKVDQVKSGVFWVEPEIESSWIYHADVKTGSQPPARVQQAYFRKTFSVPKGTKSATIQLIGDTYVKLAVNGHEAGEVYVRRSNSISAEHQRIKIFNILPLLTDSVNVLTAEARDYSVAGSSGLNIYGELRFADGSIQKITSDTTWKVSASVGSQWKTVSFDDSLWPHAVVKPYPYAVDRPDFATGRASWIEQ
ncbi:MAG: family 20 glycosylhydrolase [Ignavibacteriales bacterium]|nr:family 20 glycosylhydrolase [Ignavibacteriales bacterium]